MKCSRSISKQKNIHNLSTKKYREKETFIERQRIISFGIQHFTVLALLNPSNKFILAFCFYIEIFRSYYNIANKMIMLARYPYILIYLDDYLELVYFSYDFGIIFYLIERDLMLFE